jgi:hypothetical protein
VDQEALKLGLLIVKFKPGAEKDVLEFGPALRGVRFVGREIFERSLLEPVCGIQLRLDLPHPGDGLLDYLGLVKSGHST